VQSYGVRVPLARLTAFALSGFLAGISGALIVYVNEAYDIGTFAPDQGINVFISAVVGGVGSAFGAVLGAVVLDGSRNFLSGPWALLPSSVGVLVVLMFLPGGLAELVYRLRHRVLAAFARSRGLELVRADVAADAAPGERAQARAHPVVHADADLPLHAEGLSVRNLDVAYDDVQVLFGVDLDVRPGEITAILGTNGAGKSTLLRAIGGVAPVTAGAVRLGTVDLRDLEPDEIATRGIAQMPGGAGVFSGLTVDENLRVAAWQIRSDAGLVQDRIEAARRRFPVLDKRAGDQAGDLSGGQQQQLALAMALLIEPEVLLIDELSLGLAPLVVEQLLEELRTLRGSGTTIVIVEQSVNVALSVADHAYFMEKGAIRFAGPAAELLEQPELIQAIYLQGTREALERKADRSAPAVVRPRHDEPALPVAAVPALDIEQLSVTFGGIGAVRAVDLTVDAGEIVGLIGPNGAGKTTLFDLISGFTPADSGHVRLGSQDLTGLPPSARARLGLGRSFQDARLFPGLTVEESIATALERWIQAGDPVSAALRLPAVVATEAAVRERTDELVELFGLGALRTSRIGELSTGSRRMVDLACVVAHGPSVVLLDEPSSGIAQREAEALGPLMVDLRRSLDATLVVIEHDISLISSVADRLVALDEGAVVTSGPPAAVLDHPAVVASYLGTSAETVNRSRAVSLPPHAEPNPEPTPQPTRGAP
jgi:branched-chain amino acid transport system ATP-binding protein